MGGLSFNPEGIESHRQTYLLLSELIVVWTRRVLVRDLPTNALSWYATVLLIPTKWCMLNESLSFHLPQDLEPTNGSAHLHAMLISRPRLRLWRQEDEPVVHRLNFRLHLLHPVSLIPKMKA